MLQLPNQLARIKGNQPLSKRPIERGGCKQLEILYKKTNSCYYINASCQVRFVYILYKTTTHLVYTKMEQLMDYNQKCVQQQLFSKLPSKYWEKTNNTNVKIQQDLCFKLELFSAILKVLYRCSNDYKQKIFMFTYGVTAPSLQLLQLSKASLYFSYTRLEVSIVMHQSSLFRPHNLCCTKKTDQHYFPSKTHLSFNTPQIDSP